MLKTDMHPLFRSNKWRETSTHRLKSHNCHTKYHAITWPQGIRTLGKGGRDCDVSFGTQQRQLRFVRVHICRGGTIDPPQEVTREHGRLRARLYLHTSVTSTISLHECSGQ